MLWKVISISYQKHAILRLFLHLTCFIFWLLFASHDSVDVLRNSDAIVPVAVLGHFNHTFCSKN